MSYCKSCELCNFEDLKRSQLIFENRKQYTCDLLDFGVKHLVFSNDRLSYLDFLLKTGMSLAVCEKYIEKNH